MTKEEFIKLGVSEDIAIKCQKAFEEVIKTFVPKTAFDEIKNQSLALEGTIKDRDKQLEDIKNSESDITTLKEQIKALQNDNKLKEETYKKEVFNLKLDNAVSTVIANEKGKNTKALKALLDLDKAEFDESGNVKGLKEQIEKLKTAEDSRFLFDDGKAIIKGAVIGQGKDNDDTIGNNPFAKESFNLTQQGKIYKENPDLAKQYINNNNN